MRGNGNLEILCSSFALQVNKRLLAPQFGCFSYRSNILLIRSSHTPKVGLAVTRTSSTLPCRIPVLCSLIPTDNMTISARKETEYVRDQWDIFAYAYPGAPHVCTGFKISFR